MRRRVRDRLSCPDVTPLLVCCARSPAAVVIVALMAGAATAILVAAGGPPSPVTHLYYLVVVSAAVLWGPRWGAAVGAASATLGGPVAQAIVGKLTSTSPEWLVRALAMMLVGWACGALTRSLLARLGELEEVNHEMIAAFVRAVDARDPYTAQHSQRVALYATALAGALGLGPADVERIRLAALLHDVGKLSMERSILQKPGPLNDEEWKEMRAHPVMSAHIISGVRRFAPFLDGARHHHERYDGAGYPDGLCGDEIPSDARIIAVADAYEAMTATRAYRSALPQEEALRRLAEGAGTQFDPRCVTAFLDLEIHRPAPAAGEDAVPAAVLPAT